MTTLARKPEGLKVQGSASLPKPHSLLLDLHYARLSLRLEGGGSQLRYNHTRQQSLKLRLRLGGRVGGSVLVATPGSVHSTFVELQP